MDALVIGAGLAGLSTAYHLASVARVCVLERRSMPGTEASAQNAGMIRRLGEDPIERALAVRTAERLAELPDGLSRYEPSRVTGAVLGLVHDPLHLNDGVAHLRARGVRVEAADRPWEVAPILAGTSLAAAWVLPDERVVNAHALISGFSEEVRRLGSEICCDVDVERLLVESGRVIGVQTRDGPRYADAVVLAAGAWSAGLAATAGVDRPLIPLRRTLLQTTEHPLAAGHPWTWLDDVGVYVRPESGGWLLSGCDEREDWPTEAPSAGPVEAFERALALDKLEAHLPAMGPVRLRGGWTGLRTFAPDRRPVLGEDPELGGLWWAAGLGGFGVTCSLGIGEAVSGWMLGESVPWLDRAAVSPGRRMPRRWSIRRRGDLNSGSLVRVRSRGRE